MASTRTLGQIPPIFVSLVDREELASLACALQGLPAQERHNVCTSIIEARSATITTPLLRVLADHDSLCHHRATLCLLNSKNIKGAEYMVKNYNVSPAVIYRGLLKLMADAFEEAKTDEDKVHLVDFYTPVLAWLTSDIYH